MSPLATPATFRAMLTASGQAESTQYKGTVFGAFGRLDVKPVVALARRRGLRQGSTVLSVTIGETGTVQAVAVLQSSGRPDVDAALAEAVRQQVHVPPPPPGAPRTFTPSIAFGEE